MGYTYQTVFPCVILEAIHALDKRSGNETNWEPHRNGAGDEVLRNEDRDEPGNEPGNDTGMCYEGITTWEQNRDDLGTRLSLGIQSALILDWNYIPFHNYQHTYFKGFQHLSLMGEMFSQECVPCTITIKFNCYKGWEVYTARPQTTVHGVLYTTCHDP